MTERSVVQSVIHYIGTGLLVCVVFLGAVLVQGLRPDPVVFQALGSVAVALTGGLIGILANTRSSLPARAVDAAGSSSIAVPDDAGRPSP